MLSGYRGWKTKKKLTSLCASDMIYPQFVQCCVMLRLASYTFGPITCVNVVECCVVMGLDLYVHDPLICVNVVNPL